MAAPQLGAQDLPELAGQWKLDESRSKVRVRSTAFWGLARITGRFATLRGDAKVGGDGLATGHLAVDASSIDTGNRKRDHHLRDFDFFDAANHPTIIFDVAELAAGGGAVHIVGSLRVRATAQPVSFDAEITELEAGAVTLRARPVLDRSRWGIDFRRMGMTKMDAHVDATLRFVRV